MKIVKVILGSESFEDLISGKVIKKEFREGMKETVEVRIALQDIGYNHMLETMLKTYKKFLAEQKRE